MSLQIYFRNIWNTFEFCIEFFAILELIVVMSLNNHNFKMEDLSVSVYLVCECYWRIEIVILLLQHKLTMIASTFRVLRLLRFIPQVRLILWTVFQSLEVCIHAWMLARSHDCTFSNCYPSNLFSVILHSCRSFRGLAISL